MIELETTWYGPPQADARIAHCAGLVLLVVVALGIGSALPAMAQVPDTTRVAGEPGPAEHPPDSVRVDERTRFDAGRRTSIERRDTTGAISKLPVRRAALDLAELLGNMPGAFVYRFATPGWPDGWSYRGLPPEKAATTLNSLPFWHLFTGRPALDLAPLAFVEWPSIGRGRLHRAISASLWHRPFDTAPALTELKFWNGAAGLESIDAVHVQHRSRPMFGRPGVLNVMGTYSGRGSTGVYPGSRLRRGRQVQLRLQYDQAGWGIQVLNVHSRRTIGAHGGVIPDGTGFESVYEAVGAVVENPGATRRIVRNDLHAGVRIRLLSAPLRVKGYWTAETFRYRDEADTLGAGSDRLGLAVRMPIISRASRSTVVEVDGWSDRVGPRQSFDAAALRRSEIHVTVHDSVAILGWDVSTRISADAYGGSVYPGGALEAGRRGGAFEFSIGGALAGEPPSPVELMGFSALGAAPEDRSGRAVDVFAGMNITAGAIDLGIHLHGSHRGDPRDIYMITDYMADDDSAAVRFAPSAARRAGITLDFGWRRDADLGLYAVIQPTLTRLLNREASELHARLSKAHPEWYGRARLGVRSLLFQGDLDLDAFVDAQFWGASAGRTLHPETGLLAVPLLSALSFGPSTMISVGAEAGVRTATFFLLYENALAGTNLMRGNLIVPVYPLPARQFRFGVYWPILD